MKIAFRFLAVALLAAMVGCQQSGESTSTPAASSESAPPPAASTESAPAPEAAAPEASTPNAAGKEVRMPSGLVYQDLKVGDGTLAESGKTVTVHYTGWLTNGTKFDSSVDRGQPFTFHLGAGQVIRGWDEGVKGMRVGGKRKLTIPPDLAYGPNGQGPIPPNSTLVFDVELLNVQ